MHLGAVCDGEQQRGQFQFERKGVLSCAQPRELDLKKGARRKDMPHVTDKEVRGGGGGKYV